MGREYEPGQVEEFAQRMNRPRAAMTATEVNKTPETMARISDTRDRLQNLVKRIAGVRNELETHAEHLLGAAPQMPATALKEPQNPPGALGSLHGPISEMSDLLNHIDNILARL